MSILYRPFNWYISRKDPLTISGLSLLLVRICLAVLRPTSGDTTILMEWQINLGKAYVRCHKTTRGISYLRRTARRAATGYGVDNTFTRNAWQALVTAYQQAGRQPDAIASATELVTLCQNKLGANDRSTLQARIDLLECRTASDPIAACLAEAESLVQDAERVLPVDDVITLTAKLLLAGLYRRYGRGRDAITLAKQVAADMDRTIGAAHPKAKTAREFLAQL